MTDYVRELWERVYELGSDCDSCMYNMTTTQNHESGYSPEQLRECIIPDIGQCPGVLDRLEDE